MRETWKRKAGGVLHTILLRDRPLMTKLLVFSAVLVVIPLLLAGIVLYRQSSLVLQREARYFSWQMIDQIKMSIEDYVRDFEINTIKILNHPDTLLFLQEKTQNLESSSSTEIMVGNVLKNYAYSRSDVVNISIMIDGSQVISSAEGADESEMGVMDLEPWYKSVPHMVKPTVMGRIITWNGEEKPVISIMKRIVHPETLKPFGMLIIDLNYKRLHDVVSHVRIGETGQGYVFILDAEGRYIYHLKESLIGTEAGNEIVQALAEGASGSVLLDTGEKQLLTYSGSDSLQWTVATSIRYKDMLKSTDYIGRTIILTSVICMLLAFVLSIGFAASIVHPIKRLYRFMKRVELGKLNDRVVVESCDEVGMLIHGFNNMVARLSELLEEIYVSKLRETKLGLRQKETELQMLQAQVNPHFMYNALENIRGMALENDMDDIATMASSLSHLLRYNIKGSSSFVTVREEMEIAELYLRIQQLRFGCRLEYRFDIPIWAMQEKIAKFTLQPLIENCIVHAVEQRIQTTRIVIKAEHIGREQFSILISDTGPGITEQHREQLLSSLEQEEEDGQMGKIGLINVHKRICHFFGRGYGLFLVPTKTGMTVGVRLPLHFQKEEKGREWHVSDSAS